MTTHAPESSHAEVSPVAPRAKVFKFGFLALAVLMLLCWFRFYYLPERQQKSDDAVAAAESRAKQAADYAASHPSPQTYNPPQVYPPPAPEQPCTRPWTFQTRKIPPEGLPVYLCQGWQDFPLGGALVIVNEKTSEHLNDEPGKDNHFGFQPDGMYDFHSNPEGEERSVKILNRW